MRIEYPMKGAEVFQADPSKSEDADRRSEESFSLELLAATGRFDRTRLGKLS